MSEYAVPSYWELHVNTVKLSRSSDGSFGISIEGGSDKGQFGYVGCVKDTVIIAEGDISPGDIILKVNGDAVGGFIHWDLICEIRRSGSLLTLLVLPSDQGLPTSLKDFLSLKYEESTEDCKLQQVVRRALCAKSVPCTTRPARVDENPGIDYVFVSPQEFEEMDSRGLLLQKGSYGGHMYGTPRPDPYDPNMHTTQTREGRQLGPRQLGKLPPGWEVAYNQYGQKYFINHNEGTTTWMDPRLVALQYHSARNSKCGELPYGWEEVVSDQLGVYYIDHITKRTSTQHPNSAQQHPNSTQQHPNSAPQPNQSYNPDQTMLSGFGSPIQLPGHILSATLYKTTKGFGFTLYGGDKSGQPVLIKSVKPGSPADVQGRLMAGDILVRVNGQLVNSLTHSQVVQIFRSLPNGQQAHLELRRNIPDNLPGNYNPAGAAQQHHGYQAPPPHHGYQGQHHPAHGPHHPPSYPVYPNGPGPRSFDGADSSTSSRSNGSVHSADLIPVYIDKGDNGFGFTIHQSNSGQRIKSIMDKSRCCHFLEGDLIVQINHEQLSQKTHADTVALLKSIPPFTRTLFLINRDRADLDFKRKDRKNRSFRAKPGGMAPPPDVQQSYPGAAQYPGAQSTVDRLQSSYPAPQPIYPAPQHKPNPLTQPRLPLALQTHGNHGNTQQIDSNRVSDQGSYHGNSSVSGSDRQHHFSGSDRQPGQHHLSGSDRQPGQHHLSGSDRQPGHWAGSGSDRLPPTQYSGSDRQWGSASSEFEDVPVALTRDNNGFGFRIIGGEEQGTPVAIGYVTPDGPADGTLHIYDEIRTINGQNVLGAYHASVIELIGQAAAYQGKVSLLIRRYKNPELALNMTGLQLPELESARYRLVDVRNVVVTKLPEECFGFVIHSSLNDDTFKIGQIVENSPAGRTTDLMEGDSVLAVEGTPITGLQHRTVVELIKECCVSVELGVGTPQLIDEADFNWEDETVEVAITLERDEKGFGFSIRGGKAFREDTLFVLRIGKGGVADRDGRLRRGDEIVEINGQSMKEVCHQEAVDKIKSGGSVLDMTVRRRKLEIPAIIKEGLEEKPDSLTYPARTEITPDPVKYPSESSPDIGTKKGDTPEKEDKDMTLQPNNTLPLHGHEYDKYEPTHLPESDNVADDRGTPTIVTE